MLVDKENEEKQKSNREAIRLTISMAHIRVSITANRTNRLQAKTETEKYRKMLSKKYTKKNTKYKKKTKKQNK